MNAAVQVIGEAQTKLITNTKRLIMITYACYMTQQNCIILKKIVYVLKCDMLHVFVSRNTESFVRSHHSLTRK